VIRARRLILFVIACISAAAFAPTHVEAATRPSPQVAPHVVASPTAWMQQIRNAIGGRPVSVAVGVDGQEWFRHLDWVPRPPASNEKLLLSMALLSRFSPSMRITTQAVSTRRPRPKGALPGNLWIVGHGDPEVGRGDLVALAKAIADAGVTSIRGRVMGDMGPFRRDWFAPGWKDYFPRYYVPMPTALTFEQNTSRRGVHITDPELRAARFLTAKLEARGIDVGKKPSAAPLAERTVAVASIRSAPLGDVIRRMDLRSRNFYAEVLGKKLGSVTSGRGSIASGARAIDAFVDARGEHFTMHDASGLSYANRATAVGILRLLWAADAAPWGETLRDALPHGNQGTLEGRLPKIQLRAKTGTLDHASALSGWVWLQRSQQWAEFSILSSGFSEWTAKGIEDRIVRAISQHAVDPSEPI
jgi:D-alanyl-D-alanine carboxypeptidase/D-alanyl-D-alanine-endopeptidase (penicillin-binding protein 4)